MIPSISFSDEVRIIASEENIEQLLEIDPSNVDFLHIYAVKLVKTGKAQSATEVYKKIIYFRPDLLVFYLELARLQFYLNELDDAKKNLIRVPILHGTVPHLQKGKFSGARVLLRPASEGTGVIAGGALRIVLEAVGVHDVLSKSQGSSNPHNVVKATFDALLNLRDANTIAKNRGISLEKVFNG